MCTSLDKICDHPLYHSHSHTCQLMGYIVYVIHCNNYTTRLFSTLYVRIEVCRRQCVHCQGPNEWLKGSLEELRYKLNGARHFTKLDMHQGYMQFELSPESRYLTTFYTGQGLRRFKRLNFGTNSAAEIFNEEIRQTLVDSENVENIYDDIIVFGQSQKEHDHALIQVLQRLDDCGQTIGCQNAVLTNLKSSFLA